MLNREDKKNTTIVVLILIFMLVILFIIRSSNEKKYYYQDTVTKQDDIIIPDKDEDINFIKKISYNITTDNEVKEKELPKEVELDFDKYYQVEVNDDFILPVVNYPNYPIKITTTYYFKNLYTDNYSQVDTFNTNNIGNYKINYTIIDTYNRVVSTDVYVDIVDNISPTINAYCSGELIISDSSVNNDVRITFTDNDKVVYAEYYKEIYGYSNNTLEHDGMMQVIPIDLTADFYLAEDGIYHIRAYDSSNNYSEYTITIDKTNPEVVVDYQLLDTNQVLVTITSNEKIKPILDYTSNDNRTFTKIYDYNIIENITIYDLADNYIDILIDVTSIIVIDVFQNGIITDNTYLHLIDGDIYLDINASSDYTILCLKDGNNYVYNNNNNDILTDIGTYYFEVNSGNVYVELTLDITDVQIED